MWLAETPKNPEKKVLAKPQKQKTFWPSPKNKKEKIIKATN